MQRTAAICGKKTVLHQKGFFPCKKQATEAVLAMELGDKSWKS